MESHTSSNIVLPWPPSVNHYWRKSGKKIYLPKEVEDYRKEVWVKCQGYPRFPQGDVAIEIEAWPPDRRRRDLDNILKALLDALQHAQIYTDDYQIADLRIYRVNVPQNKVIVRIKNEA